MLHLYIEFSVCRQVVRVCVGWVGVYNSQQQPDCFFFYFLWSWFNKTKQRLTTSMAHISVFSTKPQCCGDCKGREKKIQTEGERKKERGGGVWPTFHSSLCTVGQAMHAEWLKSLCNKLPHSQSSASPSAPPWFFKIKDAIPSLLPSTSAAYDAVRLTFAARSPPCLCFLSSLSPSLWKHMRICASGKSHVTDQFTSVPLTLRQERPGQETKETKEKHCVVEPERP